MNKKRRALALGLAATQLTALSAVVSPMAAFAEVGTMQAQAEAAAKQDISSKCSYKVYSVAEGVETEVTALTDLTADTALKIYVTVTPDANTKITGVEVNGTEVTAVEDGADNAGAYAADASYVQSTDGSSYDDVTALAKAKVTDIKGYILNKLTLPTLTGLDMSDVAGLTEAVAATDEGKATAKTEIEKKLTEAAVTANSGSAEGDFTVTVEFTDKDNITVTFAETATNKYYVDDGDKAAQTVTVTKWAEKVEVTAAAAAGKSVTVDEAAADKIKAALTDLKSLVSVTVPGDGGNEAFTDFTAALAETDPVTNVNTTDNTADVKLVLTLADDKKNTHAFKNAAADGTVEVTVSVGVTVNTISEKKQITAITAEKIILAAGTENTLENVKAAALNLKFTVKDAQDGDAAPVKNTDYTVGEITGNATDGYKVTVTVKGDTFVLADSVTGEVELEVEAAADEKTELGVAFGDDAGGGVSKEYKDTDGSTAMGAATIMVAKKKADGSFEEPADATAETKVSEGDKIIIKYIPASGYEIDTDGFNGQINGLTAISNFTEWGFSAAKNDGKYFGYTVTADDKTDIKFNSVETPFKKTAAKTVPVTLTNSLTPATAGNLDNECTVTLTKDGTAVESGVTTVAKGDTLVLTVEPKAGFKFDETNGLTVKLGDNTVSAEADGKTFNITVPELDADAEGITVTVEGTLVADTTKYGFKKPANGDKYTVTATYDKDGTETEITGDVAAADGFAVGTKIKITVTAKDATVKLISAKLSGDAEATSSVDGAPVVLEYTITSDDNDLSAADALTVETLDIIEPQFDAISAAVELSITESELASITDADKNEIITAAKGALQTITGLTDGDYEFELATAATGTDTKTIAATLKLTADGEKKFVLKGTDPYKVDVPVKFAVECVVDAVNTAGLDGAANADITFKKGANAVTAGATTLKKTESLTLEVKAKNGYLLEGALTVTAKAGSTELDVTESSGTYTISGAKIPDAVTASDKVVVTVAGKIVKKPEIDSLTAAKAKEDAPVEAAQLDRYKYNRGKYTIGAAAATADGWTVPVTAAFGAMKGEAAPGQNGKNILVLVALPKLAGLDVEKDGESLSGGDPTWFTTAASFADGTADETKQYVTLWISLTEDRIRDGVEYTIKATNADSKKLKVTFTDNTEYTIANDEAFEPTDYELAYSAAANGKATVTLTPKDGKFVTAAKIKYADGTTEVTLADKGDGTYSGEVEVKKFLTADNIKDGVVDAKIKANNLDVTVVTASDIVVTNIKKADKTEHAAEFAANIDLCRAPEWNGTGKTAKVKVPSALLKGDSTSAPGTGAANICLVMEFETKLTKDTDDGTNGAWGLKATGIEDIDVEDGWRFVEGAAEANKGKYAVLWINASEAAMTNGGKVVVYSDKTGGLIAKVDITEIPVIAESDVSVTKTTLDGADEAANKALIENAVKTALGGNAALVNIAVGDLPAESGDGTVEVTLTAKTADTVTFAGETANTEAANLKIAVDVTVPAVAATKVTLTKTEDITAEAAKDAEEADIKAAAVKAVKDANTEALEALTLDTDYTITAAAPETGADGEQTVTVTITLKGNYAFDDEGTVKTAEIVVTITETAAAAENIITITAPKNGSVTADKEKAKKGETVTLTVKANSGYSIGTVTVKDASDKAVTVTGSGKTRTFVMPDSAVKVSVTFTKNSSGGSSSGGSSGGHRRPSGGSSGSTSTTVPSTSDSEISSMISSASSGGSVKFNGIMVSSELAKSAASKGVKLEVTVDSTFKWNIESDKITDADSGLRLTVSTTTVDTAQTAKVDKSSGALDKAEMSFTTKANNLGSGAKLTVQTTVRPEDTGLKFANLYKTKEDGTLEFVGSAPIAADGTTVLPVGTAGTYTIIASTETKQPGDMNNDCTVTMSDLTAMITLYANNVGTNKTRADNFKMDYDGDNRWGMVDLTKIIQDYSDGKFRL